MTRAPECMSRRQWLAAGATLAGYALAAAPSLAQAVRTDEAGLATSRSEITVGDVAMPVYEARPAAADKAPIVMLVSEIWGVHEYIRDCARRFAKAGYCAVAPELFARAGGVAQIADTQTLLMVVNNQRREALLGDLRAAMDWARRRPGVNAERVGVNGWCWGGALTIQAAARVPGLRAAVAWSRISSSAASTSLSGASSRSSTSSASSDGSAGEMTGAISPPRWSSSSSRSRLSKRSRRRRSDW